jgi:hypothetical protein
VDTGRKGRRGPGPTPGFPVGGEFSMSTKTLWNGFTLLAVAFGLSLSAQIQAGDDGFKDLFNGKDLGGWKTIVGGNADPEKVFSVKDGVIVVSGKPSGYFYTDKSYKNYILRYDWNFSKPGNSGLLVHIQDHKVWPKSVEVQGQLSDHGNIFAIGGAKGQFKKDKEAQKKAIKGAGEWNTTEVISKDGMLTAKVNGVEVSTGKGDLTEGPFGFQSEGTELYFKNIRIKVLD